MSRHLQNDLEILKRGLLHVGGQVEEAVKKAVLSFKERNSALAKEIIDGDYIIDQAEVEIEEQCLKTLALHQPVAIDLRLITAVMKINNDLERMGDCAVSIARRTSSLAKEAPTAIPEEFSKMTKVTLEMVRNCLDAFIQADTTLARQVCKKDDIVDECKSTIIDKMREEMAAHPDMVDQFLDLLTTAQKLERIADLSTNIAEDVVYLVEGEIIRHGRDH